MNGTTTICPRQGRVALGWVQYPRLCAARQQQRIMCFLRKLRSTFAVQGIYILTLSALICRRFQQPPPHCGIIQARLLSCSRQCPAVAGLQDQSTGRIVSAGAATCKTPLTCFLTTLQHCRQPEDHTQASQRSSASTQTLPWTHLAALIPGHPDACYPDACLLPHSQRPTWQAVCSDSRPNMSAKARSGSSCAGSSSTGRPYR